MRTLLEELTPVLGEALAHDPARELLGIERQADADGEAGSAGQAPNWTAAFADSVGWRLRWRYRFKRATHINEKESAVIATLVRSLAVDPANHRMKHVNFEDSSVNVHAWAKGRSRKQPLNSSQRSVVPDRLMCRMSLGHLHVRTAHNPADAATRGARQARGLAD